MPSLEENLLVFTDLDGTLLDFHTLDWQPAAAWLERLRDEQIPVILCSSKTASEMDDIQQELGLGGLPYIAENGAVIQPDVRWENAERFISEKRHSDIGRFIARVRQDMHLKFTTFDDVDERAIAEWTGLSRTRSVLARKLEASVTLIWRDGDEQMKRFAAELARLGLKIVQGARFWHILDTCCGKDVAVHWLVEQYRLHEGSEPTTLGLGDGPNDAPLLDSVGFAVVVKGFNREGVSLKNNDPARVYRTQHPGPSGWREGLDRFLT
ncbi:mannosyl-3-phosphoglycerate phosphatase-related protein [Enterobacter hormaechei]|uniref:mannosyl-3-phosphoglycerate phosphatase-related protein n=1 Tax=Enterobacter hormaechei TaxID=158836 RepID=UPI00321EE0B9